MANMLNRLLGAVLPRVKTFGTMGTSGTPVYGGYVMTPEKNNALIGLQKYTTFADILTNISIVSSGVRYFLNVISRPSWSCEAADDSDEARQAAEWVEELLFQELHTPWSRIVRRAGNYRFYGFAVQEWIAKRDEETNAIVFDDIEWRPSWTIERWDVDDKGWVNGMWQRDPQTGQFLGLPRGKVLYLVDDTLTDSPEGLGLLRHVVEPVNRLREYQKQEAYGFQRDLRGIPIARAPVDELKKAVDKGLITQTQMNNAIDDMMEFASLERKTSKTAIMLNSQPYINEADTGKSMSSQYKWDLQLLSGAAPGLADVGAAIQRLNEEIARILGVEQMLLGSGSAGSFALSKEKSSALYLMADSVLNDIVAQAQHDLIWPLWALNGLDDKLMPTLRAENVAPKDVDQITRSMKDMATAGVPVMPDDEIQNFVRDLLGAPQVDLKKIAQFALQQQNLQVGLDEDGNPLPGMAPAGAVDENGDPVDPAAGGPIPPKGKKPVAPDDGEEEEVAPKKKPAAKKPVKKA